MPFVGVRELARNVSRFLEEVEKGEEPIVVTRRGVPIAVLQRADRAAMIRGLGGRPKDVGDLPPDIRSALAEFRRGLEDLYGDRLQGIYVFGSYARGEADPENSDLDVAIVLDAADRSGKDVELTTPLVFRALTRWGILVNTIFVGASDWRDSDRPVLRNARRDALPA